MDQEIVISFNDPYIRCLLKNRDTRSKGKSGEFKTMYENDLDEFLSRERIDHMFEKMFEKIEEQEGKEAES